ncbi:uncharacterized protein LOC143576556 [Bidens hawaiensis]|uniref:uncharacterized protein LOC143576556 n=1 Tax=Bidens hawaiensis TaxID=980011 RepID=UPI00404B70A2
MDLQIIQRLKEMLDSQNVLVKAYRMARDSFQENPHNDLKLRLIANRQKDGRTYNLPTTSEVTALIVGDISDSLQPRDVLVTTMGGKIILISELHPLYVPFQYPIIFIHSEDGYRVDIYHRGVSEGDGSKRPFTTMREWFAFRIQDRLNWLLILLNSRRLLQQFLVDVYMMIESERLFYIRSKQTKLRSSTYENLMNLRDQGTSSVSKVGRIVILSSSFTGGARYMTQNYLDAMTLCKWFGYPDFFITITCNPKWPEVTRFLKDTTLKSEDRPDNLCRLFKIKLDALLKDLKDKKVLGKVQAVVYTIEFQKRGLPHAHMCLFMHADHRFPDVEHVDPFISAEIPDKNEDPELYNLVSELMIHGSCGAHNPTCSCRFDNKCSKNFPKSFRDSTSVDSQGYPLYRRRDSASEAAPRIFGYDVHYRIPCVTRLPFHLPGQEHVVYGADDDLDNVLDKAESVSPSMFNGWMQCNKDHAKARKLTYVEFPTEFVWHLNTRCWEPRKSGFSIGRIHAVSPAAGEAYFLRILLNRVKGPKSFEEIRTVNGRVQPSFRDACYALGLLEDDQEYIEAIEEARQSLLGHALRTLFAIMLSTDSLSRPDHVWINTWK